MKKEDNLRPFTSDQSREEAAANGQKGGIASGEARRRKRDLKIAMQALLDKDYASKNGETISGAQLLAIKQFEKAAKGDAKAFELVRDTAGQKPVDRVMIAEVEQDVIDEVERMVQEHNESRNGSEG